MRDEYATKYYETQRHYEDAKRRGDRAGMDRALHAVQALNPMAQNALAQFDSSREAFLSALKLGNNQDLDSEVHAGLTYCFRLDGASRLKAKELLQGALAKYKAGDDEQRTLLEYARTELKRLNKAATAAAM